MANPIPPSAEDDDAGGLHGRRFSNRSRANWTPTEPAYVAVFTGILADVSTG